MKFYKRSNNTHLIMMQTNLKCDKLINTEVDYNSYFEIEFKLTY